VCPHLRFVLWLQRIYLISLYSIRALIINACCKTLKLTMSIFFLSVVESIERTSVFNSKEGKFINKKEIVLCRDWLEDTLTPFIPSSKMLLISVFIFCFGEYSYFIFIPADPHSFCGDPSTLKKYQISITFN
jgi:hypothetical protein